MPRARYESLNVFLNSRLVGRLRRDISGAISFQYDPSWLEWEFVMPVSLSLPLREQAYSGAPVLAVFDNLLPDSEHLRRQMPHRRMGPYRSQDQLRRIGSAAAPRSPASLHSRSAR